MTRNNRRRRVLHLVSQLVGRGPSDAGSHTADWSADGALVAEVVFCHECGGWWLAVHGSDFTELPGTRIPRRLRLRLAALRGGVRITESVTPDSL